MSCGPSKGDVYENLMTEERIKIVKIDKCGEIEEFYDNINKSIQDKSSKQEWALQQEGLIRVVLNNAGEENENKKCFVFETDVVNLGGGRILSASAQINLLSTLKEDYRRIK